MAQHPGREIGGTDFEPGARLGPYRIVARLGQGGMATVYEAYEESTRSRVSCAARFEPSLFPKARPGELEDSLADFKKAVAKRKALELVDGPERADVVVTPGRAPRRGRRSSSRNGRRAAATGGPPGARVEAAGCNGGELCNRIGPAVRERGHQGT